MKEEGAKIHSEAMGWGTSRQRSGSSLLKMLKEERIQNGDGGGGGGGGGGMGGASEDLLQGT